MQPGQPIVMSFQQTNTSDQTITFLTGSTSFNVMQNGTVVYSATTPQVTASETLAPGQSYDTNSQLERHTRGELRQTRRSLARSSSQIPVPAGVTSSFEISDTGPDADTSSDFNANSHTDADTDTDTDRVADTDTNADSVANTDIDQVANADIHAGANANGDLIADSNRGGAKSNSDVDTHSNANTHVNANRGHRAASALAGDKPPELSKR